MWLELPLDIASCSTWVSHKKIPRLRGYFRRNYVVSSESSLQYFGIWVCVLFLTSPVSWVVFIKLKCGFSVRSRHAFGPSHFARNPVKHCHMCHASDLVTKFFFSRLLLRSLQHSRNYPKKIISDEMVAHSVVKVECMVFKEEHVLYHSVFGQRAQKRSSIFFLLRLAHFLHCSTCTLHHWMLPERSTSSLWRVTRSQLCYLLVSCFPVRRTCIFGPSNLFQVSL